MAEFDAVSVHCAGHGSRLGALSELAKEEVVDPGDRSPEDCGA
jgi:hypothetical protein